MKLFFKYYLYDLKKYFFDLNAGKNLRNNLFNFIIFKRKQFFFFKSKKIFLLTILHTLLEISV